MLFPTTRGRGADPNPQPYTTRLASAHTDIWPLGDSITYGSGTIPATGYRKPLWIWLTGSPRFYDVNIVGSANTGDSSGFDQDHNGHPGATIADTAARITTEFPGHVPHVDLCILLIGTNNMGYPGSGVAANYDSTTTPAAYAALLAQLGAAIGINNRILVSTLPRGQDAGLDANVLDFNSKLPAIWTAYDATHPHLIRADIATALGAWSGTNYADGVHPNTVGYPLLTGAWEAALAAPPT